MIQFSGTLRDARLDQLEATVGTGPLLQLFTGGVPANCAAADSGTKLAEMTLPSDWMAAASGGSKAKSGTWTVNAIAAGAAAHFRIKNSAGTVCHVQGTVTATGGGGDMTVDNTSLASGQAVTVNTFALTEANA
jgi:hypothetical protein